MTSSSDELDALRALETTVEPLGAFIARMTPRHAPVPWHLQQVVDVIEQTRKGEVFATISIPPRHGKTETLAHGLAWRTLYDPTCLNFYATFGDALSQQTSRKVRKLVRAAGVPLSSEAQAVHDWRTTLEGGLKATSVGGDVTGRGCNGGLIICDDIIKGRRQAESALVRDQAWDWLKDDIMSRLEPGASLIVNATRWHEDDPIGRLKEDSLGLPWRHIELPAVRDLVGVAADERVDPDVLPLWPEGGYDLERYKQIRMRGEHGWWSLYQARPTPRGGGMFKGVWFTENMVDAAPARTRWVRSWDLAASESADSAFTAGVLVGLHDGAMYVGDVQRGQWSAHTRDQKILQTAQLDGRAVEIRLPQDPGQAGKSQKPHFSKLLHGYRVTFEIESGDKATRAEPYASQAEGANVHLVRGPWNRPFINEHESFPAAAVKDQVDAMSGAYGMLIGTKDGVDRLRKLSSIGTALAGVIR